MLKRKKSDEVDGNVADQKHKSPLRADEQDSPQPERPTTPKDDAAQSGRGMGRPSQAEGERD